MAVKGHLRSARLRSFPTGGGIHRKKENHCNGGCRFFEEEERSCNGVFWRPNWAGKIKYILRPKLETEKIGSLIETVTRNWSLSVVSI